MERPRLLKVVLFHAFFSSFGEIEASVVNFMSIPFRNFLGQSLSRRYGVEPGSEKFELVYSGIASSFFVGVFLGGMSMAKCMESFGRKGTAIYVRSGLGILSASAMLLAKWLDMPEFYVLGHFIAGAVCALKVVLYIYLSECAPDNARGWSSMALGSGTNLLLLLISPLCLPGLLGNDRDWWLLPAICLLLAMVHLFVAGHFPESPKHLFIGTGRKEHAAQSVQFYHGSSASIAETFREFESEALVVHREKIGLREFWVSRRLRWSMALALLIGFVPAFSLLNLKSQYLESMLMRFGLGQSSALLSITLMTAVGTPLSLAAPVLVEWKGRRPLFLAISALSTLELALVLCAQALFDLLGGGGWMVAAMALLGCTLGQASCSLGILNMNPILVGELFPHQARAKAIQLSQMPPMLFVLAVVLAYPSAISSIGSLFLLPLLLLSLLFLLFIWNWLPETKGLPVDEIFRRVCESNTSSPKCSSSSIGQYGYGSIEDDRSKLIA